MEADQSSQPRSLWRDLVDVLRGRQRDYTQGAMGRAILLLSIPIVLELSMQGLFGLADIYFVGRLGTVPVAIAVLSDQLIMFVFTVALGFSMGTTALVARRIGEGDPKEASSTALQAIYIGIVLSTPFALIGLFFPGELLGLFSDSPELIGAGSRYVAITLGGNVTLFLLFLINAIFRGAGDPSYAMRALWLANLLNIALDPLLIFGWGPIPAIGVEGAAIATTLSRGVGVAYQLWILIRGKSKLKIDLSQLGVDVAMIYRISRVSLVGVLQYGISTLSFAFLAKIVAEFGGVAVAGYGVAIRWIGFILLPVWGMGNAAATLVGQNLGAKQPQRAERSVWFTGFANMIFLGLVAIFFWFRAEWVASLLHNDPEVIRIAGQCLRVVSYSYIFWAYGMTTVMAFNGAGDTWTPTKINFFVFWLLQIPLAQYLTGTSLGLVGVFWAVAISQSVLAVVGVYWFRRGRWKQQTV